MRMKAEDTQETRQLGQIAVDDPFQVRHAPMPPVVNAARREQAHTGKDVNRRYDLAVLKNGGYGVHDPRIERIGTIGGKVIR